MVLEILYVEPMYLQYSGILETCLALRYWFFEVLGSESVKIEPMCETCSGKTHSVSCQGQQKRCQNDTFYLGSVALVPGCDCL